MLIGSHRIRRLDEGMRKLGKKIELLLVLLASRCMGGVKESSRVNAKREQAGDGERQAGEIQTIVRKKIRR